MDATEYEAAGLYDAGAAGAADRLALLDWLSAEGFSLQDMVAAERQGRLGALPVERALAQRSTGLTMDAVAQRTGLPIELVERAQRALGLPPLEDANYSDVSVGAFAGAVAMFGADRALQFSRVLGSSIARVIDAAVSLFVADVVTESLSELDLSRSSATAAALLLDLPATIEAVFPMFVAHAVRGLRISDTVAGAGVEIAVGFVDLVGSTRLSQQLSGPELAGAVGEFETAAYDLAVSHNGRIVKFIGDAAMFVASDPGAACGIGVDLCEAVNAHPVLDTARGAVGFGTAIAQSGDYYGPMVNLVSRLTSLAAERQLLATSSIAAAVEATGSPYAFRPEGEHVLRGFAEPVSAYSIHRR